MFFNRIQLRLLASLFLLFFSEAVLIAQQQADTSYIINIETPRFPSENSPKILIDGMHNNLHQLNSGFAPFAKLAKADGFNVGALNSYGQLSEANILVIANPINSKNQGNWSRPVYTAFEDEEIQKIRNWVEDGGSLLLIADHMPFAGAAGKLANAFGFDYCDGFAQLSGMENGNEIFSKANNRLINNIITNGTFGKSIDRVTTFTGSSFSIPGEAIGILKFLENDRCLQPETAWQFNDSTKTSDLDGKFQGAIMKSGKGKIAVFGEAAMFTAQSITQNGKTFKVGFNSPAAPNNVEFIRNLLFWLADVAEVKSIDSNPETEILEVSRKMENIFNEGKYSEVADFYTDDAIMLGNNTEVKGREKLRSYWARLDGAEEWKLSNIEIIELGNNHALQRGISSIFYKNKEGELSESRVIFSLVWKKTNGEWKILLDHYSPR